MWRLLPLLLLASCAAQQPDERLGDGQSPDSGRIVGTRDLPLRSAMPSGAGQSAEKAFQQGSTRGRIAESGTWRISTDVAHTRLRCATYETGIRIGQGDADCAAVRWLTDVQFGTRQVQCNSATRIHSGGGDLGITRGTFDAANCVRVVTRCTGPC
jgi:hypothetical protein